MKMMSLELPWWSSAEPLCFCRALEWVREPKTAKDKESEREKRQRQREREKMKEVSCKLFFTFNYCGPKINKFSRPHLTARDPFHTVGAPDTWGQSSLFTTASWQTQYTQKNIQSRLLIVPSQHAISNQRNLSSIMCLWVCESTEACRNTGMYLVYFLLSKSLALPVHHKRLPATPPPPALFSEPDKRSLSQMQIVLTQENIHNAWLMSMAHRSHHLSGLTTTGTVNESKGGSK